MPEDSNSKANAAQSASFSADVTFASAVQTFEALSERVNSRGFSGDDSAFVLQMDEGTYVRRDAVCFRVSGRAHRETDGGCVRDVPLVLADITCSEAPRGSRTLIRVELYQETVSIYVQSLLNNLIQAWPHNKDAIIGCIAELQRGGFRLEESVRGGTVAESKGLTSEEVCAHIAISLHRLLARLLGAVCTGGIIILGEEVELLYIKMRNGLTRLLDDLPESFRQEFETDIYPDSLLAWTADDLQSSWEAYLENGLNRNTAKILALFEDRRWDPFDNRGDTTLATYYEAVKNYEKWKKDRVTKFWSKFDANVGVELKKQHGRAGAERDAEEGLGDDSERESDLQKAVSDQPGHEPSGHGKIAGRPNPWERIEGGWEREAVRMWWEGKNKGEIAKRLGRTLKTVENRLSLLRRNLGRDIVPLANDPVRVEFKLKQ